jgi:hypothetical protein
MTMFYRWLSRLAVSVSLALIALALVSVMATPSSSAQSDLSIALIESGGMLTSANHQVTVTVSSSAVKPPITVTLSANVTRTIPARFTVVGSAFAIEAQGSTFVPVQITVHYTQSVGVNEKDLLIVYYDTVADKWLPLPTNLDTTNHLATATTNQAGQFALIARAAITSLPSNAVIVDDLNAGFARFGPSSTWYEAITTTQGYWAGHMWWTYRSQSARSNYATWTPGLNPGQYDVYAFIASYNTNTTNARYQIVHQGTTTVYPVNQSIYFAEWVKIGTFYFGSGANNYVLLEDLTYESALTRVGFDAIAFVPPTVYLPLIMNKYPIPIKQNSGLHLGSRNTDWSQAMLQPVDGDNGGTWPTSIVVISDQIYNLGRPSTSTPENPYCMIVNVDLFKPIAFDYMRRAAQAGVKVIIRVHPSPGNFADYNDPNQTNHHLLSSGGPAGGGYCGDHSHAQQVRHVNDIVQEIAQIHEYNVRHGLHEYAFVAANEPNLEWYLTNPAPTTYPKLINPIAWQEMDTFFSSIYQRVTLIAVPPDLTDQWGTIRLLTPPMAQERLAEGIDPVTCDQTSSVYTLENGTSGYENMIATYQTNNDGLTWNNYWRFDFEGFDGCASYGDHLSSMVSPFWLSEAMRYPSAAKPNFIIESDLASWKQMKNDNALRDKSAAPADTAWSIRRFFAYEPGAVANAWLLSYEGDDAEIHWHEAYSNTVGIVTWFSNWWNGSEQP